MKILHVDPETAFGGGERQVEGLIRHLAARGHQNVLAVPPEAPLAKRVPANEARLCALRIRNDLDLRAALRLRRLVAAEDPHVVHLHTSRAHAMSLWLGRHGARSVVTRRMDYPLRRSVLTGFLYNRAVAAVVAISQDVRRRLLDAGVDAERVRVIHSAVEPPAGLPSPTERRAARARWGLGSEAVVGTVAALERRKGHDVLLRALGPLRDREPRIRCLVCGGGSERTSLERLARELGVDRVVRFLGEQREISDVLAALDVFVQPSRHEGLGVALLEAMAAGLPVVASHVGGIPETVQAGHTGLLVPAEDPGALGAAIGELLMDRDRAARMGAEGRRRVLSEFSMEGLTDRYEALYASLTEAAAGAAVRSFPDG